MTFEQVKQVVSQYMTLLDKLGVENKRHPTSGLGAKGALDHARWMCGEIASMTDVEKAMRWLGFVQGVLWVTGRRTIDEMRDDNRAP